MKFAQSASRKGREGIRERQRRDRSLAPVMRARYPQLASLQLSFEFTDSTEFPPSSQTTAFHPPARAYFCFPCPYYDCDGEFDLAGPVDRMVTADESRAEGKLTCTGTRQGGKPCSLCLEYRVVAYR